MTDETTGQAAAPAEVASEPVNLEAEVPQEKPVVEEKPEAKPEDAVAESDSDDGDDEKPKKRSGIQRLKAREKALLAENAELMRKLEQSKPAEKESDDAPPKEEDFGGDWGEYIAAKAAYKIRQDRKAEVKAENERRVQVEGASARRERIAEYQESVEELKETIKDFDQALRSVADIPVSQQLGDEILASEKGAELTYHLAKNPDKLRALNGMHGRELAKEIGRLEATLKLPTAKKQTTAPAPLKPLGGGAGPGVDLGKADMEAYVAERKRQGFGKR